MSRVSPGGECKRYPIRGKMDGPVKLNLASAPGTLVWWYVATGQSVRVELLDGLRTLMPHGPRLLLSLVEPRWMILRIRCGPLYGIGVC
jgi:hypothetical protein